ncbi:MAG: response regulator [Ignavibacteria bacterium]|nr:response regulator [Ignavibacteria bacterium]
MDTILIVDDDPDMIVFLQEILESSGYGVCVANNGVDAQTMINTRLHIISAIILDWVMPDMSGIDVLRWMKQDQRLRHIPVIMHTGRTDPSHIREGIDAGAFYYLTKPSNYDVMLSVVGTAVYDFHQMKTLLLQIDGCENPFKLLVEGMFRFKTLEEAEYLAMRIANGCPNREDALAISEILFNAVEHGNLGISYDEKTEYVAEGTWHSMLDRRLALPENAEKCVEVTVKKYPDKITVMVKDGGPGFDFQKYLTMDPSRAFDNHGRGIAIANSYLSLQYFGTGSQVLITIPFQKYVSQ